MGLLNFFFIQADFSRTPFSSVAFEVCLCFLLSPLACFRAKKGSWIDVGGTATMMQKTFGTWIGMGGPTTPSGLGVSQVLMPPGAWKGVEWGMRLGTGHAKRGGR